MHDLINILIGLAGVVLAALAIVVSVLLHRDSKREKRADRTDERIDRLQTRTDEQINEINDKIEGRAEICKQDRHKVRDDFTTALARETNARSKADAELEERMKTNDQRILDTMTIYHNDTNANIRELRSVILKTTNE